MNEDTSAEATVAVAAASADAWPTYEKHDPKGWCGDPTRGASMGRHSYHADDPIDFTGRIRIAHMPLDGDYDRLGTYWGGGPGTTPLWWVSSLDGEVDFCERASRREIAARLVASRYPKATIDPEEVPGIEDFFREYVETALAYTQEDDGDDSDYRALDYSHGPGDIDAETIARMRADCCAFLRLLANQTDIDGRYADAGVDFWHTRNEDGVGFWDGGWENPAGDRLTAAARKFGSYELELERSGDPAGVGDKIRGRLLSRQEEQEREPPGVDPARSAPTAPTIGLPLTKRCAIFLTDSDLLAILRAAGTEVADDESFYIRYGAEGHDALVTFADETILSALRRYGAVVPEGARCSVACPTDDAPASCVTPETPLEVRWNEDIVSASDLAAARSELAAIVAASPEDGP